MKPVYINGIGVISRCAQNGLELEALTRTQEKNSAYPTGKLDFAMSVPASKVRRCSRYMKMAVNTAELAVVDAGLTEKEDRLQIGTIISTGYGDVESNIVFSDSVVKGNPSLCSPGVFSATVPNSCVGQICIVNGFQGASTILTGGDPLEYSAVLLNTGKAEQILCGSIEEYNEELEAACKKSGILSNTEIAEGCAMLMLSKDRTDATYCKVTRFASASLPKCPYIHKLQKSEMENVITDVLSRISGKPDIVLTSQNGSYFDEAEQEALESVFGGDIPLYAPKTFFGETQGSGYMLGIAFGACMLKVQKDRLHTALVTGVDAHGNYMAALLVGSTESEGVDIKISQ